jgi:hypothetical protein
MQMRRMAEPDVAAACLLLASPLAAYATGNVDGSYGSRESEEHA